MSDLRGLLNTTGAQVSPGGPLTADQFYAAIRAVEEAPPHPCSLGQHVIAASSRDGALVPCLNCLAPVEVPAGWRRRHGR